VTVRFASAVAAPLVDLKENAATTGGRYFFGEDQNQLAAIYATLDRITPVNQKTLSWRPVLELFYYPLGAALALLFAYSAAMFAATSWRRWQAGRQAVEVQP
jgi:Ca-activated chloride channel family protein